jgi:hypothetical protein
MAGCATAAVSAPLAMIWTIASGIDFNLYCIYCLQLGASPYMNIRRTLVEGCRRILDQGCTDVSTGHL